MYLYYLITKANFFVFYGVNYASLRLVDSNPSCKNDNRRMKDLDDNHINDSLFSMNGWTNIFVVEPEGFIHADVIFT